MIVSIPNSKDKKFYQTNDGDLSGNIWSSWNLDLESNPGRLRVSPQTEVVYSNLTGTSMTYPIQFVMGNFDAVQNRFWVVSNSIVSKSSSISVDDGTPLTTVWEQDLISGTPPDLDVNYTDATEWNDCLVVSNTTDLYRLEAGSWNTSYWQSTLSQNALLSTAQHPLGKSFNNLLLIGNSGTMGVVASVNIAKTTNVSALIFPSEFEVVWIRSSNAMVWIGCRNKNGGKAKVFSWDGYSENYNGDYKLEGSETFAGVILNEIPYTVNERGQLLAFNGGGFVQVAKFPVFNTDYNFNYSTPSYHTSTASINRNGMTVQDNKIYILVKDGVKYGQSLENQQSGIWVYSPETGLHHKYGLTKDTGADIVDYGSPRIPVAGPLIAVNKSQGNLLAGSVLYTDANSTLRHCLLTVKNLEEDETDKIGYFITPKIETEEVEENWQKVYVLIKQFLSVSDKIYVKYRTDYEDFGTIGDAVVATWTDTNTFTIADASLSNCEVGDEIEILSGEGSGLSANISSINGTYVVIDETVTGASGEILLRASNFKKLGTDIATQGLRNFELPLDAKSSWIQLKCVMFFHGQDEIERLIIKSEAHKPIK